MQKCNTKPWESLCYSAALFGSPSFVFILLHLKRFAVALLKEIIHKSNTTTRLLSLYVTSVHIYLKLSKW